MFSEIIRSQGINITEFVKKINAAAAARGRPALLHRGFRLDLRTIFGFLLRGRQGAMSILDYGGFDDDPEDEQERKDRFDDELKKYRDMMNDGSAGPTNIEALEEIVAYYFENEKFEDALHFLNQLLTLVPYSGDFWQRRF
jgi:hypothetical protein